MIFFDSRLAFTHIHTYIIKNSAVVKINFLVFTYITERLNLNSSSFISGSENTHTMPRLDVLRKFKTSEKSVIYSVCVHATM